MNLFAIMKIWQRSIVHTSPYCDLDWQHHVISFKSVKTLFINAICLVSNDACV